MFRASLRSVSDPLREHVCISCLAQRLGGRTRLRLYSNTPYRANSGIEDASPRVVSEGLSALDKSPPLQKDQKSRTPGEHPKQHNKRLNRLKSTSNARDDDEAVTTKNDDDTTSPTEDGEPSKDQSPRTTSKGPKKITGKARKMPAIKARRVLAKEKQKTKASKDHPDQKEQRAAATEEDPTSRIKSSLQSIVSHLDSTKATSVREQESPKNLSFVMSSIHAKEHGKVESKDLQLNPLDVETAPVPRLSFGLERVLFNPGVYHLRDPRSRVYNFDPYLGQIMPVTEFDFDALKDYITSSKDHTLRDIAVKEKKKYIGSSSSMTSVLSHFHYLLSAWRGVDIRTLSQGFPDKLRSFTRLLRAPSAMFLRYQDGVYAIDADKEFESANILMNLGKSMEKLLTLPKDDFERYRRSSENKISAEEEQAIPESYHYSTLGDFLMRSQLDAYDPRLPGTGMFDLKTRAVVSIRMDARNFERGLGYEIQNRYGAFESYEREFYDMIRAAFLKYSLQVRIGRMDGIFVAFHNIERIFGFQYVSLPEMDQTLHGQYDTALGDTEFRLSLALWNKILDKVTAKFPERSIRLHFETRDAQTPFMYIFAEPVTDDEIHSIQTRNQAEIDAYQRRVLNLAPSEEEDAPSTDGKEEVQPSSGSDKQEGSVDEETSSSEVGPEDYEAEYDSSAPLDEAFLSEVENEVAEKAPNNGRELLAMTLVTKNFVNGRIVERPNDLKTNDQWTVEYELSVLKGEKARALYAACQKRREKALTGRGEDEQDVANNVYIRRLREISKKGRDYRKTENKLDKENGIVVLDDAA
ncbi:mitochondrial protein Pet127-domain-containing protein [Aspergillus pseudonomiae]|uniref:Mitochondrial protein Pet127-domain-containing protein n=1 Tax=Aspergillus pseudonomiae TaxID=1506151 RepID=A0A5N7CZ34_9EURO|nr:mitochondrial protein Pet127-domain-containing protein [Aspergillus pseudonomiae]KAB8256054.1 mitochondrial protein Pet127-domain-containing protein [Aspergillus pseudonomiae]KAE8399431.1 mitochondrial protein Pet127-domain-containing protein [Aspergillus pseudonomiae]